MQRRDFIRDLAVGAVALAVAPSVHWRSPSGLPPVGPEGWSGAAFAHLHGAAFEVAGPDGVQRMTLDDVRYKRAQGIETASLRFRGDAHRQLTQGSYDFVHPELGRLSVFVVPGTQSGNDCFYRAIFNRFG